MVEWQDAQLSDLIDIKHGFAFKGEFFTDEPTGDILVTPGNFAIGGGFQLNKPKFYKGPVPTEYVLNPGDVIVTMTDLSKQADTLGYSAVVPAIRPRLLHNQRIGRVIAKDAAINLGFIAWLMRTRPYRHEIVGGATGSTVKHTSPSRILAHRFKLPSPEEQQDIVDVLQPLDDKIELNRRTNETLEGMAQAIFRDWFVDFGPTRRKAAGELDPVAIMGGLTPDPARAAQLAALFPAAFGVEGLPAGWTSIPVSKLIAIIGGGTPKTSNPSYWNGPIPWFSVTDTPAGKDLFVFETEKSITQAGLEGSSARLVPAGTTIISARGTVGNLALAAQPMTFNQSCYALRSSEGDRPFFTLLAAANLVEVLKGMAHGSVFSTITRQTFDGVQFADAGSATMDAFETTVAPLFDRIRAAVDENRTLAETRDYLLPRLMSGAVRVAPKVEAA